jgi:outer membrane protein
MKKVLFATLFVMGLSSVVGMKVQAQTKIGYISMEELISVMPEAKKADTTLEKYKEDLGKAQQDIMAELNSRQEAYVKDSATMSQAKKDMERKALTELYGKYQSYNQDAQQQFNTKQQEVYGPIQKKAVQAIQDVAKANGYTYVIQKEDLIVSPPGEDLLPLVKKALGLRP